VDLLDAPAGGRTATACPCCRAPRTPADVRGVLWSSERGPDGTLRWVCPGCTRAALADIEAGLPVARA
jgi:hypothetical protein